MKNDCVVCLKTVVEACEHISDENWIKHETLSGKVQSNCTICSSVLDKDCEHVYDETKWQTVNKDNFEFKSVCTICDIEVPYTCTHPSNEVFFTEVDGEYRLVCNFELCKYDRVSIDETADGLKLYGPTELKDCADNYTTNANGKYTSEILTDSAKKNMPYTRITLTENTPKETFFWLCESGEEKLEAVGPYFMIVYRLSPNCPTGVEVFASVKTGFMTADNGKSLNLIADGAWHYAIFDFSNAKGWNGSEALQQLRIDIFNATDVPAGEYFDIAVAGFYSSANSAAEQYGMIAEKYGIN